MATNTKSTMIFIRREPFMIKNKAGLILLILGIPFFQFCSPPHSRVEKTADHDISFSRFVLDNGLTLIVHEDHKAPLAAINVSYRVGSKDEKAAQKGMAHLLEHLMVSGSEHHNENWLETVAVLGGVDANAETWFDETKFYVTVPVSSLDAILWLESDRMNHLLGALTQEKLEGQKRIVENEISQILSEPYGKADQRFWEDIFPPGHPYSWPVIGSADDVRRVALDDVRSWYSAFYGPSQAVLVIAGDVGTAVIKKKVEKYFGYLRPGQAIDRYSLWAVRRTGIQRAVLFDEVPLPRLRMIWNIPNWSCPEGQHLALAADILGSGTSSRLRKRLIEKEKLANDVSCEIDSLELSGVLKISVDIKKSGESSRVEEMIQEEIRRLADQGPLPAELDGAKMRRKVDFIISTEKLGGGNGKAQLLAEAELKGGDAGLIGRNLRLMLNATASDVRQAVDDWLSDGVFIQEILPQPTLKAAELEFDRLTIPQKGEQTVAKYPAPQRFMLSNGLKVSLISWPWVPIVRFNLLVNAGFACDKPGSIGTARLTSALLDDGTDRMTSHALKTELERLGTTISVGGNLDFSSVSMTTLVAGLDSSLAIFSDIVCRPSFPENEFKSAKESFISRISREESSNISAALRILPRILYGPDHPYGIPFSGLLDKKATEAVTLADIRQFYRTWFKPGNSTLLVVGDITVEELKLRLEACLGQWLSGDVPRMTFEAIQRNDEPAIYLIDRPNSPQTGIAAAQLLVPKNHEMDEAISVAHAVLAGSSTESRIGKNLRGEKHWTYMAFSMIVETRGPRYYVIYTPVQSDKTIESMREIFKEMEGFIGTHPITEAELESAKRAMILSLPGEFETGSAILNKMIPLVRHHLPDDYYERYAHKIEALTREDIVAAARLAFKPKDLVWLVMGDRRKIESGLRRLGFGQVIPIDVEGHRLGKPPGR
jgi:zinc protease